MVRGAALSGVRTGSSSAQTCDARRGPRAASGSGPKWLAELDGELLGDHANVGADGGHEGDDQLVLVGRPDRRILSHRRISAPAAVMHG
jgi:hypothetical protein